VYLIRLSVLVLLVLVQGGAVALATQQQQTTDAETLFRSALLLYEQQNYDEALVKATEASKASPNDFRPCALTGFIYQAQQKFKSASEAFAVAIRLQPQVRELYLVKSTVDQHRNAYDEAVATALKATAMFPDYAEAYALLGDLLQYSKERRAEAITALRTAIKLKPTLQQPYANLGQLLADDKDEKGAEEVFRQGMAADTKRMAGRFALGRLLVKQGRLVEARQVWEGRTSDVDYIHPQFIELLTRAENMKRATEALAAKPNDPDALVDMGLAVMDGDHWVVDGRQKRALVYFEKALQRRPNFARAQYGIVKAYIQGVGSKDETKTLERELAKLRKLDPKMAAEMDEYRKHYESGLIASPRNVDQ
jgi:tetratricopeptide (TPR) repeat protein